MILRPTRSTRTDKLLPHTTIFRSADASTLRLDHDRLRIAEQRGYDDRLGDVIDLAVLLDDLLQAAGERRDDAIGEQHAKEGADQRRSDHAAKHGGRLVDRSHGLHHAKHRRDDNKRRKRVRSEEHTYELQSLMRNSYAD